MHTLRREAYEVRSQEQVAAVRQAIRPVAADLKFSVVAQTKLITAASELARNLLDYGGGGSMLMEVVSDGRRDGIRLTFADAGPGIPDIEQALQDGFTTGGGLGLGLGGSKRLVDDFEICSEPGTGTVITVTKWT